LLERPTPKADDVALVAGAYPRGEPEGPDRMLDELASLVEAAGGRVVARSYQLLPPGKRAVHPATFIGRGKAEQIADLAEAHEANVVVFDNELAPAQIRELERIVKRKVIDRSELILDIFASRAKTHTAKLQVELAQLEYTAPRLRGMWTHLERQAGTTGPLGMRGPGEKQIEIDRRLVANRIRHLKKDIELTLRRQARRVAARASQNFCVGLVGYTNAGKSTLMNALTGAGVYAEDKLFATLDTKTRAWRPQPGVNVMLSDTVGFVRDLPHYLVASFRATLEEALRADLLLHVIDVAHPHAAEQVETVEQVLSELGRDTGAMICVLNKADVVGENSELESLRARLARSVVVSAKTGAGLEELAAMVVSEVRVFGTRFRLRAAAENGELIAFVRGHAEVHEEKLDGLDWIAEFTLQRRLAGQLDRLVNASKASLVEL